MTLQRAAKQNEHAQYTAINTNDIKQDSFLFELFKGYRSNYEQLLVTEVTV